MSLSPECNPYTTSINTAELESQHHHQPDCNQHTSSTNVKSQKSPQTQTISVCNTPDQGTITTRSVETSRVLQPELPLRSTTNWVNNLNTHHKLNQLYQLQQHYKCQYQDAIIQGNIHMANFFRYNITNSDL